MRERLIAKYGSKCVVNGEGVDQSRIDDHANRMTKLLKKYKVGIIASGSMAVARKRLLIANSKLADSLDSRVVASLGSSGASMAWEKGFEKQGVLASQLLATHKELDDEDEGASLREVFIQSLEAGIVPVFNINDPLDREKDELGKIKEGKDNDFTAEHVARIAGAKTLLLLTSKVEGVIIDSELQSEFRAGDFDELADHFYETDEDGSGSMHSKVSAGIKALDGGVGQVFIGNSSVEPELILSGETGTQVVQ